jgi:hypothetical protein
VEKLNKDAGILNWRTELVNYMQEKWANKGQTRGGEGGDLFTRFEPALMADLF